ncbi:MAG TPA: hypothetical protein VK803_04865 [Steroidobacteraceae bacterium]|jgi:uncharacterized membrane protein YphA (DoxX/SURF4 family)|nr:hypothetical protein [Steroidobacteraceae bacterium]
MPSVGILVYALGAVALGLVGLVWDDFALVWQPVPSGIPGRAVLAGLFAAALAAGGMTAAWRRTAAFGTAVLGLLFTVTVLLHVPRVIAHPQVLGAWSGLAEQLALASAGLVAYTSSGEVAAARSPAYRRVALIAFGVCVLLFGAAHFGYLEETAEMVPRWLPPGQRFWAVATGIAHLAAGAAILAGVTAHLAALLLTVMFALFGALIHIPLLLADPHSHLYWVMNAMNLALTGAAWVVADSLAPARAVPAGAPAGLRP